MTDYVASKPELQAVLDASVDSVLIINDKGIIEQFNRSAERMFGYTAAEVIGRNVSILMTGDDAAQHDSHLQRYMSTGIAHVIGIGREVDARRRDGSVLPCFLSVGRISETGPPRFVGFLQDITVRRQTIAALQSERDRANRYLEAAQTILVALNPNGEVTLINRKGCEVLGYDEHSLVGQDWFSTVVAPEVRLLATTEFGKLLQESHARAHHFEYDVLTRSGTRRQIVWRCAAFRGAAGQVTGILCSGDDVTDSRRAEQEARESRERLTHVSRLATMGEMATGISHELNQPLAAIASFADAAKRFLQMGAAGQGEVQEALESISEQALRAGEIIRRLRELVRNRQTRREESKINEVIEELALLARADARASDVRITLEPGADLPNIWIDRIQIQQVLLNLVRNAIEALAGETDERREIRITTRRCDAGDIEIQVADRGPGVAPDMLQNLFTPFATNKSNGTGLGLAISRTIIQSHKGSLTYRQQNPCGACFVIQLPINEENGK